MKNSELLSIVKKWSPIIDELNSDPETDVEKLTKKEKMCLYAHYHATIENAYNLHTLPYKNISDESRLNESTLPMSLKIIKNVDNFENIIITNSPIYEYKGKSIREGTIEFSRELSEILNDPDETFKENKTEFSLDDLDRIEKIICSVTTNYLNNLIKENENKKIFLYLVIQAIMVIDKKICWNTRLAVD
jgi:hypothetical protein